MSQTCRMDREPSHQTFQAFVTEQLKGLDAQAVCSGTEDEREEQPITRTVARTRQARSRKWPPRSNKPEFIKSLAEHRRDWGHFTFVTEEGLDSGHDLMAVFGDDPNGTPRLKYNVRIHGGRPKKQGVPQYPWPQDEDLKMGMSLEEVCKYYPYHVWGHGLRIFMAEGWKEQEIWSALPEDARNEGSKPRPWNYLQQACGREADKMYEEAGHNKRPIKKRKRRHGEVRIAEESDDEDLGDGYGSSVQSFSPQARPNMLSSTDAFSGGEDEVNDGGSSTFDQLSTSLRNSMSATDGQIMPSGRASHHRQASVQEPAGPVWGSETPSIYGSVNGRLVGDQVMIDSSGQRHSLPSNIESIGHDGGQNHPSLANAPHAASANYLLMQRGRPLHCSVFSSHGLMQQRHPTDNKMDVFLGSVSEPAPRYRHIKNASSSISPTHYASVPSERRSLRTNFRHVMPHNPGMTNHPLNTSLIDPRILQPAVWSYVVPSFYRGENITQHHRHQLPVGPQIYNGGSGD